MLQVDVTSVILSIALEVAAIWPVIAADHCKVFSLSVSYRGRYCPGDGMLSTDLLPHQCRHICLQSTACKAYNYNITDRTCTRFTSPCPQPVVDPVMEFAVFTENPIDQCYEWVSYSSGDPVDARMITTDEPERVICRMQKDGHDIVCNFHIRYSKCYGNLGSSEFINIHGYPCQRLRIKEDCSVFWVPYTAGDPINPRAAVAGHMANGDAAYVAKFSYNKPSLVSLSGHYVKGADYAFGTHAGVFKTSVSMMMLVVL